MENQSWSIVIFAYNEAGNVEKVVQQALEILPRLGSDHELVIIDDGSTDGSQAYFKEMEASHNIIRHIRIYQNKGIGNALRMGYANARKENVCAVPGDGQFDLNELLPFRTIPENRIISFYREGKNYNLFRTFLTQFNLWLNRNFFGLRVRDVNWIKIYKRSQLEGVPIFLDSSLLESELCAKLNMGGYEIVEVPSIYQQRHFGVPKGASFQTVTQALKEMLPLIRAVRRYRRELSAS